mmetsp:Transcript_74101/g.131032  ORF Transcript_74101/g.131032 Transcript_74101/m.131032 type:complete len:228 (+) Transcript_74101:868-1551(+)
MSELLLGRCLLQVGSVGSVVDLLCEDVSPLPEVVGPTEFHGLNKRSRCLPFPSNRRSNHYEVRGVEGTQMLCHQKRLRSIAMRIVGPQPLQRHVQSQEACQDKSSLVSSPVDDLTVHLDVSVCGSIHASATDHPVDLVDKCVQHRVRCLNRAPLAAADIRGTRTCKTARLTAGPNSKLRCMGSFVFNLQSIGSAYTCIVCGPICPFMVTGPVWILHMSHVDVSLPIP